MLNIFRSGYHLGFVSVLVRSVLTKESVDSLLPNFSFLLLSLFPTADFKVLQIDRVRFQKKAPRGRELFKQNSRIGKQKRNTKYTRSGAGDATFRYISVAILKTDVHRDTAPGRRSAGPDEFAEITTPAE